MMPRMYNLHVEVIEKLKQPCATPARMREVTVTLFEVPEEMKFQQRRYASSICRLFEGMPTPCETRIVEQPAEKGGAE